MNHFLYILCSQKNGTLYVGVTRNLARRIYEHKMNLVPGFTSLYHVHILVHVEQFELMMDAVAREKTLKKWKREWKIALIEKQNPEWKDLSGYVVAIEELDGFPGSAYAKGYGTDKQARLWATARRATAPRMRGGGVFLCSWQ